MLQAASSSCIDEKICTTTGEQGIGNLCSKLDVLVIQQTF